MLPWHTHTKKVGAHDHGNFEKGLIIKFKTNYFPHVCVYSEKLGILLQSSMTMYFKSACWKTEAGTWALSSARVQGKWGVICSFTLQSGKDSCLELFAQLRSDEIGVQNTRTDAAWFPQYAGVEEVALTGVLLTCSDSSALCNLHLWKDMRTDFFFFF